MTPKTILLMGPQGSGKGTQADLLIRDLAANTGLPVVDVQTGRLFRDLAAGDSYAGERVGEIINAGNLVPDTFTNAMWIADLRDRLTADVHLTFDGVPRTLGQAAVVDDMLAFFDRADVHVINLDVPEEVVVARMLDRGRADDTPEFIKVRLDLYKKDTMPVLQHYRDAAAVTVHDIDGAGTPDEVHAAICSALGV